MKKQDIRIAAFFCVILMLATLIQTEPAQAQVSLGKKSHVNITTNGKHTYQVKNKGYALEFEMKGDIELNESDTDVVSISRGGYLEIKEKQRGTRHELRIEGLSGGRLDYEYKLNGRKKDFAEIDRDWYEEMLITMIRETGAGAEQRTARILKSDGVEGVFKEIDLIENSSSRVRYMTYLFKQAKLNDGQLQRAAKMAQQIPSSGDRSRFLKGSAAQFLVSDEATPYFFDAVESIPSSGDKTRVLMKIVEEDALTDRDSYNDAIEVAKSISSSGDRSRFLIAAANTYHSEDGDAYFNVVSSLPSSGDHARVLINLANSVTLDRASIKSFLKSARGISSSGDKARVLTSVADDVAGDEELVELYIKTVETISSSGDYRRALSALMN